MKKRNLLLMLVIIAFAMSLSSCAAMFGTKSYTAKVSVPDHPDATISVNGIEYGRGEASCVVARKDANKLMITVEEEGCEPEVNNFTGRKFRGGMFVLDLFFTWLPPVPVGIIVDGATGAWFKPDVDDPRIQKINGRTYLYTLSYKARKKTSMQHDSVIVKPVSSAGQTKVEKLRELKNLLDDGVLTNEEYEQEKAKIINSEQ